ncbi:MAG: hypothetical protein ACKVUS_15040, partial [Saprospiraceae bacterium]
MKITLLFPVLLTLCFHWAFAPQTATAQHRGVFYGSPGINDACYKLIRTADEHYVTAGRVNNKAALYKFDCAGNIVDSFRLAMPNSPFHEFFDVLELPNGEFVAIGHVDIAGPKEGLAVRFTADLQALDFKTFLDLDRDISLRQIVRNNAGQVFVGGLVQGVDIDYSNVFCATFSVAPLVLQDSITEFTNGVDEVFSLTLCADGNLLLTGVGRYGNIFFGESLTDKYAFVRKIKPDGTLLWEYVRNAEIFKNKFGLSYFGDAIENENTGNILAVGNKFTGDTLTNVLDAHFLLLSPNGQPLDALTIVMPGSQNLYQVIPSPNPDVPGFFAVGDSTPAVEPIKRAAPLLITVNEVNQKIELHSALTNQAGPLTIRSTVQVSEAPPRVAFAGIYYNPAEPGENHDLYIALPMLEVEIAESGGTLTAAVLPVGNGYQYQWYTNGQPILGANGPAFTPTTSGEYTVVVIDPEYCTGEQ